MPMTLPLSAPPPPRVTVLDDDRAILALLRAVLTDAGYDTRALRPGPGAPDALRLLAPAAIVLALPADDDAAPAVAVAPAAQAWGLLALLARDCRLRQIPLVACVPDDGRAPDRAVALRHPASALVRLPLAVDDLLAHLGRLLGVHGGEHAASSPPRVSAPL